MLTYTALYAIIGSTDNWRNVFQINVNNFKGLTDSDVIDKAFANIGSDGTVLIPPRVSEIKPERNRWLIDRAILIPENSTVIMQNCIIKLSDKCRDNYFIKPCLR